MILILTNKACTTTNYVIDWLIAKNAQFLRINSEDKVNLVKLSLVEVEFEINEKRYNSNQFKSVWFYRGKFNLRSNITTCDSTFQLKNEIINHLKNEIALVEYLFVNSFNGKILGNYFTPNSYKVKALIAAKEVGLKIPQSEIITNKIQLKEKLAKSKIITKGIQDSATLESLNSSVNELTIYNNYSSLVIQKDIVKIPDRFFPTLIQEYIDKQYELRIFYLAGKCYTIAIFSQRNEKTKNDFRHYDNEKDNKQIPYKLPVGVEQKVIRLMNKMELNSGSIDMIVDEKGSYVFLEINPVGLFEVVDYYGHFQIYEKIADYLI